MISENARRRLAADYVQRSLTGRASDQLCSFVEAYLSGLAAIGSPYHLNDGEDDGYGKTELSAQNKLNFAEWRSFSGAEAIRLIIQDMAAEPEGALDGVPGPGPESRNPFANSNSSIRRNIAPGCRAPDEHDARDQERASRRLSAELASQIDRHEDSILRLSWALSCNGKRFNPETLRRWAEGSHHPSNDSSIRALERIEVRYQLSPGHFVSLAAASCRAARRDHVDGLTKRERSFAAYHIPHTFSRFTAHEKAEVVGWIRENILKGSSDYGARQRVASATAFAIDLDSALSASHSIGERPIRRPRRSRPRRRPASPQLLTEVSEWLEFQTSSLTPLGLSRRSRWSRATATMQLDRVSRVLGFTCGIADPAATIAERCGRISLGVLVFPEIWDGYIARNAEKRGFYGYSDLAVCTLAATLSSPETGWLRQAAGLREMLQAMPGAVPEEWIVDAQSDWDGACNRLYKYSRSRVADLRRIAEASRDCFEPILPVLNSPEPVRSYTTILDEIADRLPDPVLYPISSAESDRAFLMVALALQLGFRSRNLREMLLCRPGEARRPELFLSRAKRPEIFWDKNLGQWVVFAPTAAFKNANSSFFCNSPFTLALFDSKGLYDVIDRYVNRGRRVLIGDGEDPGTLFVSVHRRSAPSLEMNSQTFNQAWHGAICRYGIRNPYTCKGAIAGLRPHGPHAVRDVLATHVLKTTGSVELAAYAIQDTAAMVERHYGRFLPSDKSALAVGVLREAWGD